VRKRAGSGGAGRDKRRPRSVRQRRAIDGWLRRSDPRSGRRSEGKVEPWGAGVALDGDAGWVEPWWSRRRVSIRGASDRLAHDGGARRRGPSVVGCDAGACGQRSGLASNGLGKPSPARLRGRRASLPWLRCPNAGPLRDHGSRRGPSHPGLPADAFASASACSSGTTGRGALRGALLRARLGRRPGLRLRSVGPRARIGQSLPGPPRLADLFGSRRGNGLARPDDDSPAGGRESPAARPRRKLEIVPERAVFSPAGAQLSETPISVVAV